MSDSNDLLQYFSYEHLPAKLQKISAPFCRLAEELIGVCPENRERLKALDRLLEAKDAAVRSALGDKEGVSKEES